MYLWRRCVTLLRLPGKNPARYDNSLGQSHSITRNQYFIIKDSTYKTVQCGQQAMFINIGNVTGILVPHLLHSGSHSIVSTESKKSVSPVESESKQLQGASNELNITDAVSSSVVLQNLLELGVDLTKIQKSAIIGVESIIQMNWDFEVKPVLNYLKSIFVQDDKVGFVLSRYPEVLQRSQHELQELVQYFKSKRFKAMKIGEMIGRSPTILALSPAEIDSRLAYFQQEYNLTGSEIRDIMCRLPKLIIWDREKLKLTRVQLKDMMAFTDDELQKMIIKAPKIFISEKYKMEQAMAYLCNEAEVTHELIVNYPNVLRTRLHLLKERHMFLKTLNLLQFDPTKPSYLSLKQIYGCSDSVFATSVAKRTLDEYKDFIKTL